MIAGFHHFLFIWNLVLSRESPRQWLTVFAQTGPNQQTTWSSFACCTQNIWYKTHWTVGWIAGTGSHGMKTSIKLTVVCWGSREPETVSLFRKTVNFWWLKSMLRAVYGGNTPLIVLLIYPDLETHQSATQKTIIMMATFKRYIAFGLIRTLFSFAYQIVPKLPLQLRYLQMECVLP